jgi:hypothetical protein
LPEPAGPLTFTAVRATPADARCVARYLGRPAPLWPDGVLVVKSPDPREHPGLRDLFEMLALRWTSAPG